MSDTDIHEWLEESINKQDINCYDYDEFTGLKTIGEGGFGWVKSAEWKNRGIKVALKILKTTVTLDEKAIKEFVKELKLLRKVYYHPNVNRFLGVTKVSGQYIMVLQFADGGSLHDYLKKSFSSLTWSDKVKMAIDITKGLMCLHTEQIVHRDLHDNNILVHQEKMMIADLGLSKELDSSTTFSRSTIFGIPAFIEPQCFNNERYKRDKRSDIYSLGNLLWEISSGYPPFRTYSRFVIASKILAGERESPIEGTPSEYIKLYQQCWDNDPENRPEIQQVHDVLLSLEQNKDDIEIPDILIDESDNLGNANSPSRTSNMENLLQNNLHIPSNVPNLNVSNVSNVSEESDVASVYYSADSHISGNIKDNQSENII